MALMNVSRENLRDDRALFWVCSKLPLNFLVLILCRILIDDVLELIKMSKRAAWKKILESEEDKKKITEIFVRIDEHTKNFHVRSPTYISTNQDLETMFPSSNSC